MVYAMVGQCKAPGIGGAGAGEGFRWRRDSYPSFGGGCGRHARGVCGATRGIGTRVEGATGLKEVLFSIHNQVSAGSEFSTAGD